MKLKIGVVASLVLAVGIFASAATPEVTIRFIQTNHPSSFPPLLWVHVSNPSYTAYELANQVASSALVVDGKSFPRTDPTFAGPPGLPAQGEWDGCLPLAGYSSPLTAGKHRVSLMLGETSSNEETIRISGPVNWRLGTLKTREKEIHEAAAALTEGVPRSCVEQWLTVQDGGAHESHRVRYFLDPFFKVVVPYSEAGADGRQNEAVNGRVKAYQENRVY